MFTFIGVSDSETCECCGKTNLKRTIVLKSDDGDIVQYGVNCAAKALRKTGVKATSQVVASRADAVAYAQRLIAKNIYTLEQVAVATWNRFGFLTDVRNNTLRIGDFAEVRP